MADAVLLLWLEGPMQSWGTRARWDVRDTALEPTKSGVIGLLGCALGLVRGDPGLESLDRELRFAVRADRPGVISSDYQTVTGYHRTADGGFKKPGGGSLASLEKAMEHGESTIVSPRDYIHDAVFLVGLQGAPARLEGLREALAAPRWPLFLGRKSCLPSRPLLERDRVDFKGLEEAVKVHPRHANAEKGKLRAFIEDPAGNLERQDALRLNAQRMYDFRRCRYLEVDPPCSSPA